MLIEFLNLFCSLIRSSNSFIKLCKTKSFLSAFILDISLHSLVLVAIYSLFIGHREMINIGYKPTNGFFSLCDLKIA